MEGGPIINPLETTFPFSGCLIARTGNSCGRAKLNFVQTGIVDFRYANHFGCVANHHDRLIRCGITRPNNDIENSAIDGRFDLQNIDRPYWQRQLRR